ncbi:MAG: AGE family epimerase/isomerase [Neisseria sp.]|uniref:AGE family epimerase/isomerase n=1 Tax=Neisseria sp. TaxID=192066 RepID=UPI0026DDBA93|nr:AGE family epimerase/isomerase [Neisseria sp.]MDO4249308.1 AGE family epimerase/isomerase [Neisseria sp.]
MITPLHNPQHQQWLLGQSRALLEFARKSKVPFGFGYLDKHGEVDLSQPVQTWISCRMTHIYSIGALMGIEGCRELAEHGINALLEHFQDHEHGGFFEALEHQPGAGGQAVPTEAGTQKTAYAHAFVLLAASSGLLAGIRRADELFDAISAVHDRYFWDEAAGKMRESFSRDFSESEPYRGVNANMHTVEASLAAFDAQLAQGIAADDERAARWLGRANSILHFVFGLCEQNAYRIPEHFDENWNVVWDYNENDKAHQFRPYGATVGHALEWARLGCHALVMSRKYGVKTPSDYSATAFGLFRQALNNWHGDGAAGFVYTTDFEGNPIVRDRMHWVLCEGIGACVALEGINAGHAPIGGLGAAQGYVQAELGSEFSYWYETFTAYAAQYLLEGEGRWYHQLDTENRPDESVWSGKPDIYHAFQCLLLPLLPFGHFITAAVKQNPESVKV